MAAISVVDLELACNVVAGDCVVRTFVVVKNVAEVATVVSEVRTWEEVDGVAPVVGIWEEINNTVSAELEVVALLVTLTTNIAPKPAERVKFCKQHSCNCWTPQLQAKVPCTPWSTMLQGRMLLVTLSENVHVSCLPL